MSVSGQPSRHVAGGAALIMLNQGYQSLAIGGIALFLPLIRSDVGLSFTQAGLLTAVATLVYALMQIPSGYLADRLGPRRLFVLGMLGTNLLSFTLALLDHFGLMLANQAIQGFFRALVFAPGLLLISALFPPHRRATALGLYVAAGFTSNVFLSTLGPIFVKPLGWRVLFMVMAATGFVTLLAYTRLGPPGPARGSDGHATVREVVALFRLRSMWLVGAIQYVRLAMASGVAAWIPTYLVEDKGRSLQVAGLLVALGAALTAPSNFIGGYVSDRIGSPLLVIGVSQAILAVTTALLVPVDHLALLIVVLAVNAFFVQIYFGPLFSVPIAMLGPRTAGVTSGFGNFFANMGGFTFAYTLGAVKDATGSFAVGLYAAAGMCVLGLACTVSLARVGPGAIAAP